MLFGKFWSLRKYARDRLERVRRPAGIEQLEVRLFPGGLGSIPFTLDMGSDNSLLPSAVSSPLQGHDSYESTNGQAVAPLTVRFDFRDQSGFQNNISAEQQAVAFVALNDWSDATNHRFTFVRDTDGPSDDILNIGVGDLLALDLESGRGGILALGGGSAGGLKSSSAVRGVVWLDQQEAWDTQIGNGNSRGTHDFYTVAAHEIGHALGYSDVLNGPGIMGSQYQGELTAAAIGQSVQSAVVQGSQVTAQPGASLPGSSAYDLHPLAALSQLAADEVRQLLDRASAATPSADAIIAVVDRAGNILGVRTETGVVAPDDEVLSFMIDGAVAKARTAAFFASGDPEVGTVGPLTSRTVRFISQSTVTQREVEANPNSVDPTQRGPGFVAPIGLGGHFPPEIFHTPPVDLFAIEHTNRDSINHAGVNGVREDGLGDDIVLGSRYNADFLLGNEILAPESYGFASGLAPEQQSRGIATLPGGIPLFRDTNTDRVGDTLIGGIGVFFPGADGFATHEQGFVAGIGQSESERTNASRVLEAEYIAFAAAGGSLIAATRDRPAPGAKVGDIAGIAPVTDLDLPFGNITLVGIELEIIGPTPGIQGVRELLSVGRSLGSGTVNGTEQQVTSGGDLYLDGITVPEEWLVAPKAGTGITAAEVEQIIEQGIAAAEKTRAAIRLPMSSRTKMVLSVTDTTGEVLGLYRMKDATFFSIDVAVAKARNTAYYADAAALQPEDQIPGVDTGVAFTNRTFRFLAEPRFPSGVDGSTPPEFSILNTPGINPLTAENTGAPPAASAMNDTVLGYDAFNPGTNFHDASSDLSRQNGVVFFPGSTPLYKDGVLIGGLGVSGDGVDQDDVVTFLGAQGFLPDDSTTESADQVFVNGVRLPYIKFLRNPFG